MKENPLISIVVPIYNVEKYLRQCLDSIVNQTYKNIEIILVNDKSPDGSIDIIREYEKKDKRVVVIDCKENGGYGKAVNLGVEKSRGDWIGIVESDDFISLDMYQTLANVICEDIDIVKANFYCYYDKKGFHKNYKKVQNIFNFYNGSTSISSDDIHFMYLYSGHPSIWSSIYRKDIIINNNIKLIETKGASFQDISFWFNILFVSQNIILLPDKNLYYYRQTNNNSSIYNRDNPFKIFDNYRYIRNIFIEKDKDKYMNISQSFFEIFCYNYKYTLINSYHKHRLEIIKQWKKEIDIMIKKDNVKIYLLPEATRRLVYIIYNRSSKYAIYYFIYTYIFEKVIRYVKKIK